MPSGWAIATGGVSLGFLEWLEEGLGYTHPRWGKPKVDEKLDLSLKPIVKTGKIQDVSKALAMDIGTVGLQAAGLLPSIKVKPDVLSENMWKQELSKVPDVAKATVPSSIIGQTQAQVQTQAMKQMLKLKYKFDFDFSYDYKYKFDFDFDGYGYKNGFRKFPFVVLPDNGGRLGKKEELIGQAYQVMIKTRQYVKGKPVGREKFRSLTKTGYNYNDAMSMLGSALDHSIAQTGYIKPIKGTAKRLRRNIPSRWGGISHKFSIRRGKWVENRIHAIDTPGEVRELNVYQWHRGLPKRQLEKEFGLPNMGLDMYSFDRMQMNFNKALRKVMI